MHELTDIMKELHKQSGQAYLHLHLCAGMEQGLNLPLLCRRLGEIRRLSALAEQRADRLHQLWSEDPGKPRP